MRKRGAAASAALAEGSSSSSTHEHEKPSNAVAKATVATAPRSGPPRSKLLTSAKIVMIAIHILACLVYMTGLWLRISFHSGQECDMTYSYPNFIPIATNYDTTNNTNNLSQNYRLYKFVDGRDPRYQELLSHQSPSQQVPVNTDHQHCFGSGPQTSSTTTIVLYIPGHEGSYTQARSLGAHGTTWTQARHDVRPGQRALMNGQWRGGGGNDDNDDNVIPLSQFVYEVYAVDFAAQGGALHGNYLKAQSDYVVHVLQFLQEACQVSQEIQVVAHSMGGYVAKLALAQLSSRAGGGGVVAQNVITLATPHNNPLYAFDETIHEVHQESSIPSKNENDTNDNTLWISISGGLRDEMIAPEACEIPTTPTDKSNSLSYLASDWMTTEATKTRPNGARAGVSSSNNNHNNCSYGMDHRAIVWCHGVLEQVRRTIWTLSQTKVAKASVQERQKRVQEVLGVDTSYSQQLATMKAQFQAEYGILPSFAMDCAMLYHLPLLYTSHVILAALHTASSSTFCMPWVMVFFFTGTFDENTNDHPTMSIPTLSVLTLVASSIHFLLVAILKRLVPFTDRILFSSSWRLWMGADTILVALGLAMTTTVMKGHFLVQAMIFVTGILAMCVASISIRPAPLGALILLATPGIMSGVSILAIHQGDMEPRSWWIWLRFVGPVLAIRSIQSSSWGRLSRSRVADATVFQSPYQLHRTMYVARAAMIVGILHWRGPNLLTRGHAYEVVDLVHALLLLEISLFFNPLI